jgi:O-antigen biosynthesis protein
MELMKGARHIVRQVSKLILLWRRRVKMPTEYKESDVRLLKESGLFNEVWYLTRYPEVKQLNMDPVIHYLWLGAELNRDPSPSFSTSGYLKANPDVARANMNPLVHYAGTGRYENRNVPTPASNSSVWKKPETTYVAQQNFAPLAVRQARLVAFYLPQFHQIPENDRWWGAGFTEWNNVRPARAQFVGHYQPHVPHPDIGYYSLTSKETQKKQIELAKIYGIEAFCFYYYWFAGKRLLESPIEAWLEDSTLDHPFCLCWANENWSRRWDGSDHEILIAQQHSPDDDLNCIKDIARYLKDPRYLRIDGRPLLLIYRPAILPSARDTVARWRDWCRNNGIGEIYLACTQSFGEIDDDAFGFDAVVEFPPNNSHPPDITDKVIPLTKEFSGNVYDWRVFLERSESYKDPRYKLFRSVCPGWDNTARRKSRGAVFVNNTPDLYQDWLNNAISHTSTSFGNPQERLIFVNAWNEWAEGAHLEPDRETGFAYLEATRRAVSGWSDGSKQVRRPIALVCHDAYQHGAQYLALSIAQTLSSFDYEVHVFILGKGPLKKDFLATAYLHDLSDHDPAGAEAKEIVAALRRLGAETVICNTVVSGAMLPIFKEEGYRIVSLVHEMTKVLEQNGLDQRAKMIARFSDRLVFASEPVLESFEKFADLDRQRCRIRPQGLYKSNEFNRRLSVVKAARKKIRKELNLAENCPIVLGVGYGDRRKGVDLFVKMGLEVLKSEPDAHFIWLGADAGDWTELARRPAQESGKCGNFTFPGLVEETSHFYSAADVFALTSREDPYPSVVLEAMDSGLPIVGFARATGMDDLLHEVGCALVPQFDEVAFGQEIVNLLSCFAVRKTIGQRAQNIIKDRFYFPNYVRDILEVAGEHFPKVSVIVPNYNYARYICDRLESIISQSFPIYELIVLDDASSDGSVEKIRSFLADCPVPAQVVVNNVNSGSVFKQWRKGIELAQGDLIWIAEADDLASPAFLRKVVAPLSDPEVVISYCQSRQIDERGFVVAPNYLDYVADLSTGWWREQYVICGSEEVSRALFLKNTIPNVSAVVFRKSVLQDVFNSHGDEIESFRNAGDWVTYLRVLERGKISFVPDALNDHRRHENSVTIGSAAKRHLDEIVKVHSDVIARFELGSQAIERTRSYAQLVAQQFGIAVE